jgi:hypothetical protein
MANKIKGLGFIGECGYNQLLYPVEKFSRTLLSWFIQKLPRTEDEGLEETLGANALLNRRIMESLKKWRIAPKLLPFCTSGTPLRNIHHSNSFITTNLKINNNNKESEIIKSRDLFVNCSKSKLPIESSVFEKHTLELINDVNYASKLEDDFGEADGENKNYLSTVVRNAISAAKQNMGDSNLNNSSESKQDSSNISLSEIVTNISQNADIGGKKLERGTRFSHANEFSQDVNISIGNSNTSGNKDFSSLSNSVEEQAKKKEQQEKEAIEREEELETLRKEILDSQNKIDAQDRHNSNSMDKLRQLESELLVITTESERLERELMIKRKTLEMLPSATEHIEQLQKLCSSSSTKLMKLAQEWEGHRRPLLEQLRQKKSNKGQRRARCRGMVEEMKLCREEMSSMIQDLKDKQERSQVLNEEMEKLPKNMNRSIYTHRIMDIISQISKQNKEIDKITVDIRDVQKTINSTTTSMQRADAVAEELVFTAADSKFSDLATVETYRSLRKYIYKSYFLFIYFNIIFLFIYFYK